MIGKVSPLLGGDAGISQTVEHIKSAVYSALRDSQQRIRLRAENIIRSTNLPERKDTYEIQGIFDWVKSHFHYVHDPQGLEFVKSPEVIDDEIKSYGKFLGDCDDVSGYLAALLKSIGYKVRLTVMNDVRSNHNQFQHIYVEVYSPQQKFWLPLDSTARKKPFGWSAPAKRIRTYEV